MKKLTLALQEYLKCNFASGLTMWMCSRNLLQRLFHHLQGDGVCFKLSHLETQISCIFVIGMLNFKVI
jgi:hypothetical protein